MKIASSKQADWRTQSMLAQALDVRGKCDFSSVEDYQLWLHGDLARRSTDFCSSANKLAEERAPICRALPARDLLLTRALTARVRRLKEHHQVLGRRTCRRRRGSSAGGSRAASTLDSWRNLSRSAGSERPAALAPQRPGTYETRHIIDRWHANPESSPFIRCARGAVPSPVFRDLDVGLCGRAPADRRLRPSAARRRRRGGVTMRWRPSSACIAGTQARGRRARVSGDGPARPGRRQALRGDFGRAARCRIDQPPAKHRRRLLREARLPDAKTLVRWTGGAQRRAKPNILERASCQFITNAESLIVAGPIGSAKTSSRSPWVEKPPGAFPRALWIERLADLIIRADFGLAFLVRLRGMVRVGTLSSEKKSRYQGRTTTALCV